LTRGILARGISPERLTVVEHDPELAKSIASRFVGVHVIEGDAFDLENTLAKHTSNPFAAIVSGLPLLNYSHARRRALIDAAFERMKSNAPFIQFSYGFSSPISPSADIGVSLAAFVWKNLPPARVWVFRKR
jgi:phosphatidylethanolamine/phosphatidyl-N-methylethanolamine N-methyltransferase